MDEKRIFHKTITFKPRISKELQKMMDEMPEEELKALEKAIAEALSSRFQEITDATLFRALSSDLPPVVSVFYPSMAPSNKLVQWLKSKEKEDGHE